jgi:hypothetical protein
VHQNQTQMMSWIKVIVVIILMLSSVFTYYISYSNTLTNKVVQQRRTTLNKRQPHGTILLMKDGSTASTYMTVGSRVRVCKDVWHNPVHSMRFNANGLVGTVTSIWDKCEVDPHCCCAELAHEAPIEVSFATDPSNGAMGMTHSNLWKAQFALDELLCVHNATS